MATKDHLIVDVCLDNACFEFDKGVTPTTKEPSEVGSSNSRCLADLKPQGGYEMYCGHDEMYCGHYEMYELTEAHLARHDEVMNKLGQQQEASKPQLLSGHTTTTPSKGHELQRLSGSTDEPIQGCFSRDDSGESPSHVASKGCGVEKFYDFADEIYDGGPRSKIFKAYRRSDRTEVAIKVRAKKSEKTIEQAWRGIMNQLRSMTKQSPHVLDIVEIFEDDDSFFVVMPMCDSGDLFEFLATEASIPEFECKRIIREILWAVGHLHENNLLHRDVKPENILFDIDQDEPPESPKRIKLIDFDTCMEWTAATPKGEQFVGTPGYIAPEVLLGAVCPQSDLWSIGVILYVLMTGYSPWTTVVTLENGSVGSPEARKMYRAMKRADIDWVSDPWPEFPLARDLCQKLIAFKVGDRPASVSEALAHPWLSA